MGVEIDLLANYPRAKRDPKARAAEKTKEDIATARKFGKEFFDGDRRFGYGGYSYDPARWEGVVQDFIEWFGGISSVLDVGCAKGGLLAAFRAAIPGLPVEGLDVSRYAISNAHPDVKDALTYGTASHLPYDDKSFDIVVSINTIHNLDRRGCFLALKEIQRVGHDAYVTVDAYRTDEEKKALQDWNLTAKTILHEDQWKILFDQAGYRGDYGFWRP